MSSRAPEPVVRFDLAIQRNHVIVYAVGFVMGIAGQMLGVYPIRMGVALAVLVLSCTSAFVLTILYRRGVDRRLLNPVWMVTDVVCCTLCVYGTGGIGSPWYIWYAAAASAAAFASGKKAAYAVMLGSF